MKKKGSYSESNGQGSRRTLSQQALLSKDVFLGSDTRRPWATSNTNILGCHSKLSPGPVMDCSEHLRTDDVRSW